MPMWMYNLQFKLVWREEIGNRTSPITITCRVATSERWTYAVCVSIRNGEGFFKKRIGIVAISGRCIENVQVWRIEGDGKIPITVWRDSTDGKNSLLRRLAKEGILKLDLTSKYMINSRDDGVRLTYYLLLSLHRRLIQPSLGERPIEP